MKHWKSQIAMLLAGALWLGAVAGAAQAQGGRKKPARPRPKKPQVDVDQAARRIAAALASVKPTAKPAKPRKMLVFSVTMGFRHKSIPVGIKALEMLGRKTGAFEAVVSDDLANFEPQNIRQFDAICFNNTTRELFLPHPNDVKKLSSAAQRAARLRDARLKKSLLDFVKAGGGVVGIHAAVDSFYDWPEFGRMMGGYFDGHPWRSGDTVTIKAEDPDHPVARAFKGRPLTIKEEIYQVKAPYSRDMLRVLLVLDTARTNMNKKGIKRRDNDFAVAWVRSYEAGRVFYSSFGHNNHIYWTPQVLQHYLDGIQFALGDLPADTTPSNKRPGAEAPAPAAAAPAPAADWTVLFDGSGKDAWRRNPKWVIDKGALTCKPKARYLWTKQRFGDFVLAAEFKVAKGTNSGIFIRTGNPSDPVQTGMEIQVLDSFGKGALDKHGCGALYDALAPSANAAKKPGQWNQCTITCKGPKITVVLNGRQVLDADLGRWTTPRKNPDGSKNKYRKALRDYPREGHIGLQEHGKPVWFRNIRIKEL